MSGKVLILILGMSRAGTSAITRVLSLCGLELPPDLAAPNHANPTGFWESTSAIAMNEAFLRDHGSSWCDPSLELQTSSGIVSSEDAERYVQQICSFIAASPSGKPLVIKEPRITSLTSFWFEAGRRSEYDVRVIIPVRHPFEVAASLAKRDGATFELSNVLWLKAYLLAERGSRHVPRVFVSYANLLKNWREQTQRIQVQIGIDLQLADAAAIDGFLDVNLHTHQVGRIAQHATPLPWTLNVFEAIDGAARDQSLAVEAFDDIFEQYSTCERYLRIAAADAQRLTTTLGLYGGLD